MRTSALFNTTLRKHRSTIPTRHTPRAAKTLNLPAESYNNTLLRPTAHLILVDQPPADPLGSAPAATRTNDYRNSDRHLCQRKTSLNYRSDRALSPQNTHFLVHPQPRTIAAISYPRRLLFFKYRVRDDDRILLRKQALRTCRPCPASPGAPCRKLMSLIHIRGLEDDYLGSRAPTTRKKPIRIVCHCS